jgi:hypothetical protein
MGTKPEPAVSLEFGDLLRDLAHLAWENAEVRAGRETDAEYFAHCELVYNRIMAAFSAGADKSVITF